MISLIKGILTISVLFLGSNAYANSSRDLCYGESYSSEKFYEISGEACLDLGVFFLEDIVLKHNEQKAFLAFSIGCDKNNARSCYQLANMYLKGKYVTKDIRKAIKYNRKSCQGSYMKACRTLRVLMQEKIEDKL